MEVFDNIFEVIRIGMSATQEFWNPVFESPLCQSVNAS